MFDFVLLVARWKWRSITIASHIIVPEDSEDDSESEIPGRNVFDGQHRTDEN